jgi:hypothetical protein
MAKSILMQTGRKKVGWGPNFLHIPRAMTSRVDKGNFSLRIEVKESK